jgi:hypothetical protein
MAVRVIQSSGRRAGLPGKKANIYTVQKYGGLLTEDHAMGLVVYRSTTQSIAASTWAPVSFDSLYQADGQSRLMWSSGSPTVVTIVQSDWYFLSATVQCAALAGTAGDQFVRFRFYLSTAEVLPGDQTMYPNQYSFPLGCGIAWYMSAGTTVQLQVSHTYSGSMALNGGINQAVLKIGRMTTS